MPIRAFLPGSTFEPDVVAVMGRALEGAIGRLGGAVNDETRRAIAVLIIAAATAGERDEEMLIAAGLRFIPMPADDNERRTS